MSKPIDAEAGDVVTVDRCKYHVTSTRNASVYGHSVKHCDASGCSGDERYLGLKLDRRANNGPESKGLTEAAQLVRGPEVLIKAMRKRAADLKRPINAIWREAAELYLNG